MLLRAALLVDSWNKYHVYFFFMQFLALYAFVIFMSEVWPTKSVDWFLDYDYYGVAFHSFELGVYWLLTFILVPVACAALQLLVVGVPWSSSRTSTTSGRELDHGHVDGESLEHSRKDNTFVPLRSRYSLHGLVDRCLGRAAPARPDLVTQDSIQASPTASAPGARPRSASRRRPSRASLLHAADQSFHAPSPKAVVRVGVRVIWGARSPLPPSPRWGGWLYAAAAYVALAELPELACFYEPSAPAFVPSHSYVLVTCSRAVPAGYACRRRQPCWCNRRASPGLHHPSPLSCTSTKASSAPAARVRQGPCHF